MLESGRGNEFLRQGVLMPGSERHQGRFGLGVNQRTVYGKIVNNVLTQNQTVGVSWRAFTQYPVVFAGQIHGPGVAAL
jgi:hypothetical protein